ncbi:peptide chain release factor N(5)-glutamine methyltransferase [bacterium]|nr:peptide chain release factor N(5)-glutamine methyltransferase [bacterium]
MTLREVLDRARRDAGLSAEKVHELEYVVAECSGWTRSDLLLHLNVPAGKEFEMVGGQIARRLAQGCPAEYIIGSASFRDIVVRVEQGVLIPRPETEQLVQMVIDVVMNEGLRTVTVLDVCSGSGAIALSIAKALPGAVVVGLEIDSTSVSCSRQSARDMGLSGRVSFVQGNVLGSWQLAFKGVHRSVDVVVSNPPYVRRDRLASACESSPLEPVHALYGGVSGLTFYRRIIAEAPGWLRSGGMLLLEIDDGLEDDILNLCERYGLKGARWLPDFRRFPRYVEARRE